MKLSAIICLAVGVILLVVAGYFFVQEQSFLQRAEHLTGTVTDLSISTSFQDQQTWTDYCPVIDFRTNQGKSVEYTSDTCSNPADYKVGQKVNIYYDPNDPNATQMPDKYASQYAGVFIPLIVGFIFAAIGLGIYWAGVLRRRSGTDPEELLKEFGQVQKARKPINAQRQTRK